MVKGKRLGTLPLAARRKDPLCPRSGGHRSISGGPARQEALYERNSTRGVRAAHAPKLRRIMSALDVAQGHRDLDIPGFRTHPLSGRLEGHWSVWVSGNWRVPFRFVDGDVELVDCLDYH